MSLNLNRSLRITVGIGLALLLMQGVLFYVVFDNFKTAVRGNVEKQQYALVTTLAKELDDKIQEHLSLVENIAKLAPTAAFAQDAPARAFLLRHAEICTVFDHGLFLFAPDGKLLARLPRLQAMQLDPDFSYRDQIKEVTSKRRPVISLPYVSPLDGEPVVMFLAPVFDGQGRLRGLLGGALSLLHDNFLSNVAKARIGSSGYLYLFAQDRTMIVHPDRSRILQHDVPPKVNLMFDRALAGFEGSGETVNSRGLSAVSAFKRLKMAPWVLGANFPVDEAFAPLKKATNNLLIAFAVTMLGSGLSLRLITGRMRGEVAGRAEAESYAGLLLESVGEGVLGITEAGNISFANQGALQLLGYDSAQQLLGRNAQQLLYHGREIDPDGLPDQCLIYQALGSKSSQHSENEVLWRRDLSSFLADFSCTSVWSGERFHGGVITFRDISERREIQERLRLQAAALEVAANSIMITDRAARISWVNRAFTRQTGYAPQEAVGCHPVKLLAGRRDPLLHREIQDCLNGKFAWHGELLSRRKDGSCFDEEVTITPLLDDQGEITHFISIMQEITERKRSEEALLQGNMALEQANSQLVLAIDRAEELALKAERANAAKSEFLANMSHEIRTPMNAIIGVGNLLLDTKLTANQRDYLRMLTISAELLTGIIDDILDFSKIEAGKLEIARVEFALEEVVGEQMTIFAMGAKDKGVELRAELDRTIPGRLLGDARRLAQILNNLVSNALKFTRHGFITLAVTVVERDAQAVELEFCVRDSGIGIRDDHQAQLFQAFTQVDGSVTRNHGGTGLGLAICKRLAELMGGRIWCESTPGIGSVFSFRLPFAVGSGKPAAIAPRAASPARTRFNGERILLVEDNVFNQKVAVGLLKKGGLQVTVASNGVEALELIERYDFDLVLMDIQMPEMDGLRAARLIRQLHKPGVATLPILAVSANAMEHDMVESLAAGMNAHITKPFTPESFYGTIGFWLGAGGASTDDPGGVPVPERGSDLEPAPRQSTEQLDVETGIRQVGGDLDLYRELLSRFVLEYGGKQEDIGREVSQGNLRVAAQLAHSVKGIAGVLAAGPLQLAAQRLEEALKGENEPYDPLIEIFRKELTATLVCVGGALASG